MEDKFDEKKKKLASKKAKIELQEKLLKEQERKIRTRRLIELGSLIVKAGLGNLNNNTLLGALLELKNKAQDQKAVKSWTDRGAQEFAKDKSTNKAPIIVTFSRDPQREVKSILRDMRLYWNVYRSEWQGYADPKEVKEKLHGFGAKIEIVNS